MPLALAALAIVPFMFTTSVEYERPAPETYIIKGIVTGYNAVPEQTNERYWETASGREVDRFTAACPPELEFGTKIEVQGKVYVCWDRMNIRYREADVPHFDLLFEEYDEAISFGRQKLDVIVYK